MAPEMRTDIERLMEVTKTYDTDMVKDVATMIGQQMAQIVGLESPEAFARCQEIALESLDEMFTNSDFMEEMNAIYARHFSHEDVRQMIAFYETPVGRKTIEVMPQLMSESMQVTMRWLAEVNPVIQERVTSQLREEGLIE